SRRCRGYVVQVLDKVEDEGYEIKPIIKVIDKEPLFGQKEVDLALWMEKLYFSSRGEIMDTMIPGGKRDVIVGGLGEEEAYERKEFQLTEEQLNAVRTIVDGYQSMYYLFGITGSGKTEVFLQCAEEIIKRGGQVIYLVPEITLTHQLALQVLKRFKDNVAILHSGLTEAQRITQWRKIKRGEVGLVIGARSAVFAPCNNLKLIIIDEEHENSYKSGNDPRYHARQVAQKRISQCSGKLLMGSATPSLEAWNLMKDPTKLLRINLTKRVGGGALPTVHITDMNKEKGILSEELKKAMINTLEKGKQVILFLNRRGFSYYFHCKSCGYELKCPNCDVSMTYHKHTNELVCHYCNHHQKPLSHCPSCGSLDVMYGGFGTEQVQREVELLFPQYKIARLDTDTAIGGTAGRKVIDETLDGFRKGEINILLGTQMVAKGLNFPNVALVGIVLADSGLMIPDFRAEERTFDLLVQVSGRAGRSSNNGHVYVQTRLKDNPAIQYASQGKVEEFFNRELEVRRETDFPPFSRMINLVFRSTSEEKAKTTASSFALALRNNAKDTNVFGANECPLSKIQKNYRYQVLLRSKKASSMVSTLQKVLSTNKIPSGVYLEVDVDPLDLL
ncbi:MAG: primosomal protein N', partial [Sphaerochaetaceae bacterium]|nr:primosomal protein N' [Sphaerochaetaceae bacterium]